MGEPIRCPTCAGAGTIPDPNPPRAARVRERHDFQFRFIGGDGHWACRWCNTLQIGRRPEGRANRGPCVEILECLACTGSADG